MDIFFQEPNEIPLPPEEVRILEFTANPYPDGHRVRIYLEITPFQKRPSLEVVVLDAHGAQASTVSIIETISRKMEFTMHLRQVETAGQYTLTADVFYEQDLEAHQVDIKPEPTIVDRGHTEFSIEK